MQGFIVMLAVLTKDYFFRNLPKVSEISSDQSFGKINFHLTSDSSFILGNFDS